MRLTEKRSSKTHLDISRALSNLYTKHRQLQTLQEYVKTSSKAEKGCYFVKNSEIEIILDDFFIPEAI